MFVLSFKKKDFNLLIKSSDSNGHDQGLTTIVVGLQVEKIMQEELFSMA
jgi:hypothetical protein